ncbi:MAG: phosphoheptose isomerase [Planctomycetota bacterium]|nr:MAG: phosphoheptose isomerase [Planctomycetota bacterium]
MKDRVAEIIRVHQRLLTEFEAAGVETVIAAAEMIAKCFAKGGCLYLCGNGGSAADAQHIAGEFVGRFRKDRKALPAVALTTDTSVLTCIGNDFGFEDVFVRQVEVFVASSDVLWVFSTSGTSKNVVAAAEAARKKSATIIAFTGSRNTPLESLADICLTVEAPTTACAQEIHQLAYHIICDLVDQHLFGDEQA